MVGAVARLSSRIGVPLPWTVACGVVPALTVLALWAGGVLRSRPSVALLLASCASLLYVARLSAQAAAGAPDRFVLAMRVVVLLLAAVLPVYFDDRTFDIFNLPKLTLLMAADVVLAAAMVGRWCTGTRPALRGRLWIAASALLVWTGVAAAAGQEPVASVLGSSGSYDGLLAAGAFTFLLIAVTEAFDRRSALLPLKALYFAAAPLVLLYGLFQLHDIIRGGTWDWASQKGSFPFKNASIWSSFGNPDHLGAFVAIVLPLGLVLFLSTRHLASRMMIGLISLVGVVELVETQARGSWIALPCGLIVAAAALWPRLRREPFAMRVVRWSAVSGAVLVAALLASGHIRHRITSAFQIKAVGSSGERVQIWHTVLRLSGHHLFSGIGPDVLPDAFPRYQTTGFLAQFGRERVNGAHNILLEYLSGTGVVGLALFVALVALAIRTWRDLRRDAVDEDAVTPAGEWSLGLIGTAGVAAGLVAYLVQAMFNVQQIGLTFLFWLLLGLMAAMGPRSDLASMFGTNAERGRRRPTGARRPRGAIPPNARSRIGVGIGAALALIGLWACTRLYRADVSYASALSGETLLSGKLAANERSVVERGATDEVRSAIALDGWNADYALQYARGLVSTLVSDRRGTAQQATDELIADRAFRKVVSLQPINSVGLAAYGQFLLGVHELNPVLDPGALGQAVVYLERAVANDPTNTQFRSLLSRAHNMR